jgi:MIP family channel proteins
MSCENISKRELFGVPACELMAEFIGTLFLVLVGCGAVAASTAGSFPSFMISIAFGGVVCIMIYAVGHISGAHFNPAVTVSFLALDRITSKKATLFIIAQVIGALVGAYIVLVFWPETSGNGVTHYQTFRQGFIAEFILSFLLMFIITAVATDSRAVGELAGIAIGTTVMLCALVGGGLSGASMNPARSFGPAIVNGDFDQIILYLTVPIIGAVSGAFTYSYMKCEAKS